MGLLDFILNLAGLLLWLSWLPARLDPLSQPMPQSLAGTLKRAKGAQPRRWLLLGALAALLVVRAVFYQQLGAALDWTFTIDLAVTRLPFRNDLFSRVLLYSVLSFGCMLAVFYVWLLFLSVINRRLQDSNPFQKLVRACLGPPARWPWPVQALLPFVLLTAIWLGLHPLLARCDIVPRAPGSAQLFQQGLLISLRAAVELRYLIAALLLGHLLLTYVYLGNHSLWDFVNATGRNLLAPLRRLPLRLGKVDFAPVVGMILVFLLSELGMGLLSGSLGAQAMDRP